MTARKNGKSEKCIATISDFNPPINYFFLEHKELAKRPSQQKFDMQQWLNLMI
jgi:hypothetical protein